MQASKNNWITITIVLIALFIASSTSAKEKIIWPYLCFKPVYICDDSELIDGSGFNIYNLLWAEMTENEHTLLNMPIKRIIETAKKKENILFYGLYKTTEREKYFHFSLPCRISTPTYLVIRKSDLSQFGDGRLVSLQQLLKNNELTFLYLESISFGKGIDELTKQFKHQPNVVTEYNTTDPIKKSLKLLLNKRIDYMLSMDGTPHDAVQMGVSDKITYLPIREQNQYDLGYIVAPKNDWGKTKIEQINEILRKEIPKESFFQYFTPLVDENVIAQLRDQFNKQILTSVNVPFKITTIQNHPTHELSKAILKEAYSRIGHNVQFESFPGLRSLTMANQGQVDGDAARIKGTEKSYKNLLPVPTPLLSFEALAFSRTISREIDDWQDLKGLRVGIIRGVRYAETGTKGLAPLYAEDIGHLFKLLAQDRIQVAITTSRAGQIEINRNYKDNGIKIHETPLYSTPLYHFVNRKHKDIIPKLDRVFKDMKDQGAIVEIIDTRFQQLLNNNSATK